VVAFFFFAVPSAVLYDSFIDFPLNAYPKVRGLPYPPPSLGTVTYYFPLLVFACAAGVLSWNVRKKRVGEIAELRFTLLFTTVGILFLNQARVRSDIPHLFPAYFPAIVVFCALGASWSSRLTRGLGRYLAPTVAGGALMGGLAVASFGALLPKQMEVVSRAIEGASLNSVSIGRARGIQTVQPIPRYESVIRFIQEHVAKDEKIYVGNFRHDLILMNDVMLYFLSERESATRYHDLCPGVATLDRVQREIIRELEKHKVRYVVLAGYPNNEPNEGGVSSGAFRLDKYLRQRYRRVSNPARYEVWGRR
jgi:hypothetical protein